jgi:hypothetical protein
MANAKYIARSAPLKMHLQLAGSPHIRKGAVSGSYFSYLPPQHHPTKKVTVVPVNFE